MASIVPDLGNVTFLFDYKITPFRFLLVMKGDKCF